MRNSFNTVVAAFRWRQTVPAIVAAYCLFVAGSADGRSQNPPVLYLLDLRNPASHLVDVTMHIPQAGDGTELQIPAWSNLYQIRDFVRNLQDVRAECQGRPVSLRREDINTWASVESCADLKIHYEVYANQESVFSAILDGRHAFLNFALLLLYLPHERQRPVRVKFLLPEDWKLITMLDDGPGPGEYQAPDYDRLADSPAEAGKFQEYDYVQEGAEYRIVVDGDQGLYSSKRLLEVLEKITSTETTLMQGVPFKRYTFMFFFPEKGGGGMEHRAGTAISIPADQIHTGFESLEDIAAHEFFHLWNVKRIRPQGLEPIDYIHGNDTSDLWFSEGVTNTYAQLTLLRAGLINSSQFYNHLAAEIGQLNSRPARNFLSVEESGREAWLEKYLDYFRPERSISYYNKGELLGYLLDLAIRHESENRYSLDDVMQWLNREFARRGRFFSDSDLENIMTQLAPAFAAREFFSRNISGAGDLNYGKYLGYAGLALKIKMKEEPDLGFDSLQAFVGPIQVESVVQGSNADKAGLQAGDILLKMDGVELPVTPDRELVYFKPGQKVVFTVQRGTRVLEVAYLLGSKGVKVYHVEEMPNATSAQLTLRRGWLMGGAKRGSTAGN
ncbi:MAG: M61 family peptidase [Acidobacteria bacterium]|nr:MAG: M61 family peptidase [Acidobacteriota bacterium]